MLGEIKWAVGFSARIPRSRMRLINRRLQRLNVGIAGIRGSRHDIDLCGLGRDSLEGLVLQDRTCRLTDFDRACSVTGKQGCLDISDKSFRNRDLNLHVSETGCDVLPGVLPVSQGCRNLECGGPKTTTSRQEY